MLVLSRSCRDEVHLILPTDEAELLALAGKTLKVLVVDVRSQGIVRLGFDAPLSVKILRNERLESEAPLPLSGMTPTEIAFLKANFPKAEYHAS